MRPVVDRNVVMRRIPVHIYKYRYSFNDYFIQFKPQYIIIIIIIIIII
jgi:hypothetical protein